MPNQLQLQQYTPEQSQESINEIRRLVQEAELPAELLVEIGQWAQQVIQDRAKFPEFQAWLKSKGLPDSEIPDDADYQELAAMAAMGEAVRDMMPEQASPQPESAEPVAPIAPEQMIQVAAAGRNGDTQLAHINAEEAEMLQAMGGTGTINPATGLPEYGFFSDLWKGIKKVAKAVAPYALPIIALTMPALIPAIGTSLGASAALAPVIGSAVIAGGAAAISGGDLKQVLTSAALTGLGSYLTPIVGKYAGGLVGVESPTLQSMLGSAIFSGSVVAARGGTVGQILTAAATGGAASYLGQVATNALNSGGITNPRVTQKAFDDAVFLAADAKGLADAGIGKNQMIEILSKTGATSLAVSEAVNAALTGASADSIAVTLTNKLGNSSGNFYGQATGAERSVIGGGNVSALESVQRAEDALFVTKDAQNLKAAGLNQSQIELNLRAAGVNPQVASMAAAEVMRGATTDAVAQSVVNSANKYAPTNMFGEPQQFTTATGDRVAARELGTEPATVTTKSQIRQQTYTDALQNVTPDYTTGSTASDIDFAIADAKQLYAQGLSRTQIADVLKASGMSAPQANYLGGNADLAANTLKYDLNNISKTTPVYQAAPPPPAVPETPVAPPTATPAPVTPPPSTDNTTTQVFDDGSVLVTDNVTGAPVSVTDTTGAVKIIPAPPPATTPTTPAPVAPATNTDPTGARVRAENLVRQNPNFTPQQVQDFLVRNYNFDPAVALDAANTVIAATAPTAPPTTTQVFDDGSQLTTDTQTGQVVQATPGTDVVAPTPIAPSTPAAPTTSGTPTLVATEQYGTNGTRYVYSDGSAYVKNPYGDFYQTQSAGGEYIGAVKVTGLPVVTTPTPTPAPEVDVSTNVQVFDDGSILVTDGSGQVIGVVDNTGASDNLTVTNYDDGSILISDSQGEPLGGVDSSGNTFNINNQGDAVYQDTQQPIAPPPTTPTPVAPPPAVEEGYGEGYPENIDIAGSTPPPVMPPPLEEPPTDDYSDYLDNLPPLTEPPQEPEIPVNEIPYVPPYVPPEPEAPTRPPQGTYVPAAPDPRYAGRLPLPGLNPGYMEEGVRPMYETTSPVQGQYYWGNQPLFQTLEGLKTGYNAIQNAPQQPWGAQRGWWEQPMVNPATYNYDMSFQPAQPQGQLPGYYGTPVVDYTQMSQRLVPVAPQLTPISEYKLAKGQYYDASGNPVAG